jgi:hypothetical protein
MLSLHKQLAAAKTSHDQTSIQRQIEATDREIDHLVYELYELTDDEIKIVEEALRDDFGHDHTAALPPPEFGHFTPIAGSSS